MSRLFESFVYATYISILPVSSSFCSIFILSPLVKPSNAVSVMHHHIRIYITGAYYNDSLDKINKPAWGTLPLSMFLFLRNYTYKFLHVRYLIIRTILAKPTCASCSPHIIIIVSYYRVACKSIHSIGYTPYSLPLGYSKKCSSKWFCLQSSFIVHTLVQKQQFFLESFQALFPGIHLLLVSCRMAFCSKRNTG